MDPASVASLLDLEWSEERLRFIGVLWRIVRVAKWLVILLVGILVLF